MSDRRITHEVKLQKSVIIILGLLAVGVMANAFAPAFNIKDAMATVMTRGDYQNPIVMMIKEWPSLKCIGCD